MEIFVTPLIIVIIFLVFLFVVYKLWRWNYVGKFLSILILLFSCAFFFDMV